MKNMKKVCSIMLTLALVATMMTPVFATEPDPATLIGDAGTNFNPIIQKTLGLVRLIGYAFAVGMLLYLGIKYMMSSANEKADLKKGAINYVIGAIVVFAATTIVTLVQNFASQNITAAP